MADANEGMVPVKTPSGGLFYVHEQEQAYFNERATRYLKDNHFTNVSDFQDLDRLLLAELLVWRTYRWISNDQDYWGDAVDANNLQKAIREHSAEIRHLKEQLGLDKKTRDKERGEDSIDHYVRALGQRAKEFGYMRNEQFEQVIILMNELIARVTLHKNCDEQEALEQKATIADLFQWIDEVAIPSYQAIDEEFRRTKQKTWIQNQ